MFCSEIQVQIYFYIEIFLKFSKIIIALITIFRFEFPSSPFPYIMLQYDPFFAVIPFQSKSTFDKLKTGIL